MINYAVGMWQNEYEYNKLIDQLYPEYESRDLSMNGFIRTMNYEPTRTMNYEPIQTMNYDDYM